MGPSREIYGTLVPVGGGDPIPLIKTQLLVGRRPSCDIRLEFENVSGKHATLTLMNGLWHVKDMGSTNGTHVNGARLSSPHTVLPEDELGFADHLYTIDYTPSGPESLVSGHQTLEEEVHDERRRHHSLMELAGLDTDGKAISEPRPHSAPKVIERLSADEAEFEDAVPKHFKPKPAQKPNKKAEEDDFLKLIEDEVVKKPE
ncbi:FHA domain-containing protein [Paludisphaera rhizosphaerae]|uniref:FHA domain-containing protein n=1 Tax=Paludisphaera rhizosphaerae TaxID=2711216 RepID=UPI0013ED883A|nr:FHA domain-containing protein [Paludisphaera rhizosphaerae]